MTAIQPGDTVLGLRLDQGGHLTHGSPVNASGILYHFVSYGVTPEGALDYDAMAPIVADLFLGGLPAVKAPVPVAADVG